MDERADGMRVSVTRDGPYSVAGDVPVVRLEIATNEAGESVSYRVLGAIDPGERYILCRCGHSKIKPMCDFTHAAIGFVGTESADHPSYMEQSVSIEGRGLELRDARKLCAEARFCYRAGGLWHLIERCADPEVRALAEEEATLCPSGRYVAADPVTHEPIEPDLEPSIALIEDPQLGVSGPLWVRGRIPVVDADGEGYERRNRVTLCRCGESGNKPFCDASHIGADFDDGYRTETEA